MHKLKDYSKWTDSLLSVLQYVPNKRAAADEAGMNSSLIQSPHDEVHVPLLVPV